LIFVDTVDEVLKFALRNGVTEHPAAEPVRIERTALN